MDERTLGRLFIVGFFGTSFDAEIRDLLDELNPSGVVLFSRNIEDPHQLALLNHDIQRHGWKSGQPGYFISVDQEGGRVRRLREPFSVFAPLLELARSSDPPAAVLECATQTARDLKLTGFTTDFAPVMDVLGSHKDLSTTVIGDRSLGDDPSVVAELGLVMVRAMRAEGIIPCVKHFPGHGGTLVDSHVALPVDRRAISALEDRDLIPFRRAVQEGIEMIMTGHILFPAIDTRLPASLSPSVVGDLLRGSMHYRGLVVTDDLDMGAVAGNHTIEECAVRACAAGSDLLLICNRPDRAFPARSALWDAVEHGELSVRQIEDSLSRIDALKARYRDTLQPCSPARVAQHFAV